MSLNPLSSPESSFQDPHASKIELDKVTVNGAIDQARLLTLFRSTDSQGRSLCHTLLANDLAAIVHDAIARPITALEQLIMPLENKESVHYYPKHTLVLEIFRKANMIELDEQMQTKLDRLAKIYAAFLEKPQRTEFLTDLVGFKTLHTKSVTQLITVESAV